MDSDLLKIILQIETLVEAAKGLPSNPVPDGINPAQEGSTFDNKKVIPYLSTNEKMRVKRIAEIFKEVLFPKPEAERIKAKKDEATKSKEISQNLKFSLDDKSLGKKGVLGGLLGSVGEVGGLIGAVKFGILGLAGAIGVSAITLAGGKAFQWFVEGLKAAQGIDWKGIDQLAKTFTGVIKDIVFVVKDLVTHFISLGVDIAKMWFSAIRDGVSFAVEMIGKFADSIKKYKDVRWEDLSKAGAGIAGFMATFTTMGLPPVAIFQSIGNIILTWTNLNLSAFGKNVMLLSDSLDRFLITLRAYKNEDLIGFSNILKISFGTIASLAGISLAAPLAALGSFTAQVASLGIGAIAESFVNLSVGVDKLGKAQHVFADGIRQLQGLDPTQLTYLSNGVSRLGKSMVEFGVGSIFSSFFKSDELKGLIQLADSHANMHSVADAVEKVSVAFRTWSNLPLDDLSYNLNNIQESVSKLSAKKLEAVMSASVNFKTQQDTYTKATYEYIVTGRDNKDTGNGLLSLTRDILDENKKLNLTAIRIRDALLRIEEKQSIPSSSNPTANLLNPFEGRRTTQTNPRDELLPFTLR